jgi:hypothetical protein
MQVGNGDEAGERVIEHMQQIADRSDELLPAYGFLQAEREVASATGVVEPGQ